jgi:hypothetical protein
VDARVGTLRTESDVTDDAPLTEPQVIPCLHITGAGLEFTSAGARFVGWVNLPDLGGETRERRIVVRFAMSDALARDLERVLHKGLARGGH